MAVRYRPHRAPAASVRYRPNVRICSPPNGSSRPSKSQGADGGQSKPCWRCRRLQPRSAAAFLLRIRRAAPTSAVHRCRDRSMPGAGRPSSRRYTGKPAATGAGNGMITISKGTLPLALFGPQGYGVRSGLLSTQARMLQAASPLLFGLLLDRVGIGAVGLSAGLCLAAFGSLFLLRSRRTVGARPSPVRS